MPTYTYVCLDCGHRFDAFRRMSQRTDALPCPACAGTNTELGISAPFVARAGGGGGGSAPSCSSGFG